MKRWYVYPSKTATVPLEPDGFDDRASANLFAVMVLGPASANADIRRESATHLMKEAA